MREPTPEAWRGYRDCPRHQQQGVYYMNVKKGVKSDLPRRARKTETKICSVLYGVSVRLRDRARAAEIRRPARRCMRASELVMMMSRLNRTEFEHSSSL